MRLIVNFLVTLLGILPSMFCSSFCVFVVPYAPHIGATFPMLLDRQDDEPMVSINKMPKSIEHWAKVKNTLEITIANVALLSVSSKSEAASMLACSNSRFLRFISPRVTSAAQFNLPGHTHTLCSHRSKKKKKIKKEANILEREHSLFKVKNVHIKTISSGNETYPNVMHNWLKRILAMHQTRMLNKHPSKHQWLWCMRQVAAMH